MKPQMFDTNAVPGHTLTIDLVGRICLVEHEGRYAAVFLDAERNRSLGFPKHFPALRTRMQNNTQAGADLASITIADESGRSQAVWDLRGFDLRFEGLMPSAEPRARFDAISDVRAAYERVDPAAGWRISELLDARAMPDGIAGRLWLDGFERIDSMNPDETGQLTGTVDLQTVPRIRTFLPGAHRQNGHSVVRCTARFREFAAVKPTLILEDVGAGTSRRVPFDSVAPIQMTFSNLCRSVDGHNGAIRAIVDDEELMLEDAEFALYYELLQTPPARDARPVPFIPRPGAGSVTATQCVPLARLSSKR